MPEVKPNVIQDKVMDKNKNSFIRIYDPEKPTNDAIKKLEKATNTALDKLEGQQKIIRYAMIAVIAVVTVGFVTSLISVFTIFIDSERNSTQKYTEYIELLKSQDSIIQNLKQAEVRKVVGDNSPAISTTTSKK